MDALGIVTEIQVVVIATTIQTSMQVQCAAHVEEVLEVLLRILM